MSTMMSRSFWNVRKATSARVSMDSLAPVAKLMNSASHELGDLVGCVRDQC